MRHQLSGRRLGVPSYRRKAMLRQLTEALFLHGRIRTTLPRAKEVRPIAERIITFAKKGTLHHRRQAFAWIARRDVVNRLFDHVVEWYKDRLGGYTRIIKLGPRTGDAAPMAFIELVDWIPGEKLLGQHLKQVKVPEGEEGKEAKAKAAKQGKADKAEKPSAAKAKKKKPLFGKAKGEAEPAERKSARDPEKDKKISARLTEKERLKKERAQERAQRKQASLEKKSQGKAARPKPHAPQTKKAGGRKAPK